MHTQSTQIKTLLELSSIGFARLKFIYNEQQKPIDFELVDVNRAVERMTGLKRKELIKSSFKNLWSAQIPDTDYWINIVYESVKNGKNKKLDYYSDQLEKLFKMEIISLEKDSFAVFITENTLSKEEINHLTSKSEDYKKLFTAVEQGPTIVVITDYEGNLEYVNKKFQSITGYSFQEIKGKNPKFLNSGKLPKSIFSELWSTIKSGEIWNGIFHNKRKNGETYWEEGTISPVFDDKGHIVNFVKISQDITGLKEASEELGKSRERLKSIINNLPGYLVVLDERLGIISANNRWMDAMSKKAITIEEIAIKKIVNKLSTKKGSMLNTAMLNRLKNGKTIVRISRSESKSFKIMLAPILNEEKRLNGIVEYAIDITELEEAKVKAQEANRTKSEFLAHMSHEIRNPLNAVIGFTDILRHTQLDDLQERYLNNIQVSANSLMEIINDILDFSKIENRKLQLNPEPVNLTDLLEKTINLMQPMVDKKKIKLIFTKDDRIPPFVLVDVVRLRQIITNLLSNAIKFTEQGEIELKVACSTSTEITAKRTFTFSVRDTGIGISKENMAKIFDAFSQAEPSTTKRFGGTGLGLAITNKLLEMMDSKLALTSELGRGSIFSFSVSLAEYLQEKLPNEEKEQTTINKKQTKNERFKIPIKIMIVEDNALNMEMTKIILSRIFDKATIICADNGQDAFTEYQHEKPQLIFMDIQLPQMNGYEATQKIRQWTINNEEKPFIVALSATSQNNQKNQAAQSVFNAYMIKPVSEVSFEKVILQYFQEASTMETNGAPMGQNCLMHFNQKRFAQKMGNDKEAITHIIKLGRTALEDGEQMLEEAFEKKDTVTLEKAAHQLKGMALNMHFEMLHELTKDLEEESTKKRISDRIKELYEQIQFEIKLLKEMKD